MDLDRPMPDPSPPRRVFDVNGYGGFLYMVGVALVTLAVILAAAAWHGILWLAEHAMPETDKEGDGQ